MNAYCVCFTSWAAAGLSNETRAPVFPVLGPDEGAASAGAGGKGRHSQESAVDGAGEARQSPRVT